MSKQFTSFLVILAAMLLSLPSYAQVTESHGIITDPGEGEHTFYTRAGEEYYISAGMLVSRPQVGRVEMVEATDGTIYIRDIISSFAYNTWVKATKSGNTLTVPAGQPVAYDTNDEVTVSVYWGSTPEYDNIYTKETTDIIFTIEGNTIKLDNSDKLHFIGVFYDDEEDTFTGYANYNIVWTLDEGYTPSAKDLVQLPEGAEVQTWYFNSTLYNDNNGEIVSFPYSKTVDVAFVGNDVYLDVLDVAPSWIKGTKDANNIYTFESFQYLGNNGATNYFATGSDGYERTSQFQNFQMTYDPEEQTLTSLNYLLANIDDDYVRPIETYKDIIISQDAPAAEDPVATTGPNVDTLPYSNTLTTAEEFNDFGVLDANEDENTWTWENDDFYGVGTRYSFNYRKEADDWLISPAIKLEAGKHYRFAIDARATGGSERFEVKATNGEAKASVLAEDIEIIPSTNVTATSFTTYENSDFTVNETGYYHFGVHAITPEGSFNYLYMANFLVEAGPDESAPAAVDRLTVTPFTETLGATITFTAPTKTLGGATLSAGDITKIEVLRDGNVINTFETPAIGAPLTYTDEAADLTIGNHQYQVVSYGTTGIGGKSEVVTVFLSAILTAPTSFDLTKQDVYNTFQTINANGDTSGVWDWGGENGAYYFESAVAADDYLISPGIQLVAGQKYKVTVTAKCHSSNSPERFEVKAGKEATVVGLSQTLIGATKVTNESFKDYSDEFTVPENGIYHIAVHAISDPDMWKFYVSRIAIDITGETGIQTVTTIPNAVDVYALDGTLVRRQTTTFSGLKGIFVVNGKKLVLR